MSSKNCHTVRLKLAVRWTVGVSAVAYEEQTLVAFFPSVLLVRAFLQQKGLLGDGHSLMAAFGILSHPLHCPNPTQPMFRAQLASAACSLNLAFRAPLSAASSDESRNWLHAGLDPSHRLSRMPVTG